MNVKKILLKIVKITLALTSVGLLGYGLSMWIIYEAIKAKPGSVTYGSSSVQESIDSSRFIAFFVPLNDGVSDSLARAHMIESMLIEKHLNNEEYDALVFFPVASAPYGDRSIECVIDNIPWKGRYGRAYYRLSDTTGVYPLDTMYIHFSTPYRKADHPFGVTFKRVPLDELQ